MLKTDCQATRLIIKELPGLGDKASSFSNVRRGLQPSRRSSCSFVALIHASNAWSKIAAQVVLFV